MSSRFVKDHGLTARMTLTMFLLGALFVGIVVGPVLALCSLEFVGRDADHGWALAERLTPAAYVVWSLWLAATGVALLVSL